MKKFTITSTNIVKGIALILLLWHHLFYLGNDAGLWYGFGDIGTAVITKTATMSKICVAIFLILSGYGLVVSENSHQKGVAGTYERITKLLFEFWAIYILFVPLGFFLGNTTPADIYGAGIKGLCNFVNDFLGVAELIGTPSYNSTWWFMGIILSFYTLFPVLYHGIKKCPYIAITVAVYICFVHDMYWLLPFTGGMYLAEANIIQRLLSASGRAKLVVLTVLLIVAIPTKLIFGIKADVIFGVWIVLATAILVKEEWKSGQALAFIGKHSSNIFMFHTFIFSRYFKEAIYWFRYPPVILVVLLVLCLVISVGLEKLKSVTKYYKLCDLTVNLTKKEK